MKSSPETYHQINLAARLEVLTWGCAAAGLISLSLIPFQNDIRFRLSLAVDTLLVGVLARTASRGAVMLGGRLNDLRDVSDQMYTQQVATEMYTEFPEPGRDEPKTETTNKPRKMFKIEWLITEKEKYPHVLIIGQTGSGKTLLAEYLVDRDKKNTLCTFVSPARDDNEFIDYDTVGLGFNYTAIGEYIRAVVREMQERYNTPLQDVIPRFKFRNVIIDEGTDASKHTPSLAQDVLTLIGMARKRFIRVWMCTTAQNVKALNIEGEGESRHNFVYVRVGAEAVRYLQQLVSQGVHTQEDASWFLSQADHYEKGEYRLCLVNDMMCILPDLSGYRKHKLEQGAVKPSEPDDDLLLILPNGDAPASVDARFEQAANMFEMGCNKTTINNTLGLKGDKRKRFWEDYDEWQKSQAY